MSASSFDLHGCLVIDQYKPLTYCPLKGLYGVLRFLPPIDFDKKFELSEWASTAEFLIGDEPSICAVEVVIPPTLLRQFIHDEPADKPKPKLSRAFKSASDKITQTVIEMLERRRQRNEFLVNENIQESEKLSGSESSTSKHSGSQEPEAPLWHFSSRLKKLARSVAGNFQSKPHTVDVVKQLDADLNVVEDPTNLSGDDTAMQQYMMEDQETYLDCHHDVFPPEDFDHVAEFYQSIVPASDLGSQNPLVMSHVSRMMAILLCIEAIKNCLAVVFYVVVDDPSIPVDLVNIPAFFPPRHRTEIRVTSIVCTCTRKEFGEILNIRNDITQGVSRAAITPIPLQKGDHIYREMRDTGALRLIQHHGIYVGQGRVIHFAGNELNVKGLLSKQSRACIKATSIRHFLNVGGRLKVRKYVQCDPARITIARAEEAVALQSFGDYSLLKNNCEHFCYYCKTGKSRCKQIERDVNTLLILGALTGVATAVLVASHRSR